MGFATQLRSRTGGPNEEKDNCEEVNITEAADRVLGTVQYSGGEEARFAREEPVDCLPRAFWLAIVACSDIKDRCGMMDCSRSTFPLGSCLLGGGIVKCLMSREENWREMQDRYFRAASV